MRVQTRIREKLEYIKVLSAIALVILVTIGVTVKVVRDIKSNLYYNMIAYEVENFKKYKKDFDTLAELAYEYFNKGLEKGDDHLLSVYIYRLGDGFNVAYRYENKTKNESKLYRRGTYEKKSKIGSIGILCFTYISDDVLGNTDNY